MIFAVTKCASTQERERTRKNPTSSAKKEATKRNKRSPIPMGRGDWTKPNCIQQDPEMPTTHEHKERRKEGKKQREARGKERKHRKGQVAPDVGYEKKGRDHFDSDGSAENHGVRRSARTFYVVILLSMTVSMAPFSFGVRKRWKRNNSN